MVEVDGRLDVRDDRDELQRIEGSVNAEERRGRRDRHLVVRLSLEVDGLERPEDDGIHHVGCDHPTPSGDRSCPASAARMSALIRGRATVLYSLLHHADTDDVVESTCDELVLTKAAFLLHAQVQVQLQHLPVLCHDRTMDAVQAESVERQLVEQLQRLDRDRQPLDPIRLPDEEAGRFGSPVDRVDVDEREHAHRLARVQLDHEVELVGWPRRDPGGLLLDGRSAAIEQRRSVTQAPPQRQIRIFDAQRPENDKSAGQFHVSAISIALSVKGRSIQDRPSLRRGVFPVGRVDTSPACFQARGRDS